MMLARGETAAAGADVIDQHDRQDDDAGEARHQDQDQLPP